MYTKIKLTLIVLSATATVYVMKKTYDLINNLIIA